VTDLWSVLAPGLVSAVAGSYALVWLWNFGKRVIR